MSVNIYENGSLKRIAGTAPLYSSLGQNYDGAITQDAVSTLLANIIGTIEYYDTALYAHDIDTYFIWKDRMVRATTAIAAADTIALGTNVEAAVVGNVLGNLTPGRYLKTRYIGNAYTAEIKEDISSGKFEKVRVGDYLIINDHKYYFAHPDYWLNVGDTRCTQHHMVVVPAAPLVTGEKMNDTNVTTGGYLGSTMRTSNGGLPKARTIINNDFGSANILPVRRYFTNAVTNGKPSGGAWETATIELMNEPMVYGSYIFTPGCDGSTVPNLYTESKSQLLLYQLRPDILCESRTSWWLSSVVSSAAFALVTDSGNAVSINIRLNLVRNNISDTDLYIVSDNCMRADDGFFHVNIIADHAFAHDYRISYNTALSDLDIQPDHGVMDIAADL